jgi:hypothetical protein
VGGCQFDVAAPLAGPDALQFDSAAADAEVFQLVPACTPLILKVAIP